MKPFFLSILICNNSTGMVSMKYFLLLFSIGFMISCSSKSSDGKKNIGFFPTLERVDSLYFEKGSDTPITGTIQTNYENGNPYVQASFQDGKLNGTFHAWFTDGQKMGISEYLNGKINGISKSWHQNGQVASIVHFVDGRKEGLFRAFYATGQQSAEAFFEDGKLDSTYTRWQIGGHKYSIDIYDNGKLVKKIIYEDPERLEY